jgi:hypothetical protein
VIATCKQRYTLAYPNKVVEQHSVSSLNATARRNEFETVFQLRPSNLIGEVDRLAPCPSVIGTLLYEKTKLAARKVADHVIVKAKEASGIRIEQQRWIAATTIFNRFEKLDWRPGLSIVRASTKNYIDGALGLQVRCGHSPCIACSDQVPVLGSNDRWNAISVCSTCTGNKQSLAIR